MTNTIEVPISLIKAGDMDAIRELLPKPDLFGRWAEHPDYGRGVVCSARPDQAGLVEFTYEEENRADGTDCLWVDIDNLTLDQVELTTKADFENAPVGTIVAYPRVSAYQKIANGKWERPNATLTNGGMASVSPWKILRWGWGE